MASEKALLTRQKILDTARKLVVSEGAYALTMDRVAERCGISKGSFLYHFPTKRALLSALVVEYAEHLDEMLQKNEAKFADEKESLVFGFSSWYESFDKDDGGYAALGVVLLAMHVHDPEMLEPVRQWYRKLYQRIQSSPTDAHRLLAAVMAFEGFFFTHKFGLDLIEDKTKKETWHFLVNNVASVSTSEKKSKKRAKKADKK